MGKIYNIDLCEVENMLNSIDRVTRALGEGAIDMCDNISAMDDSVYAGSDADAVRDGMNNMTCNIIPKLAGNYETMRGYLYDYYDRLRDAKQNANGFGLTLGVSASGTTTGLIKCDFDAVSNVSSLCTQIEEVCLDFESRINNIIDYASWLRHEDGTKIVNLMNQFGTVNSKVMKFMDTNRNNIVTYATKYVSADDDLKIATALFLGTLHHNVSDLATVKRSIGKFAALGMVRNINRNGAVIALSEIDDPEIGELVEGKTIDDTVSIDTNALFNTIFKLLVKDSLTEEEKTLLEECYLQVEMYGLEEALWDSFHIYYLQMYAQLRIEYPFGTQQNIDFFAKMWTWSVRFKDQEKMQMVVNVMSKRDTANVGMLAYMDSFKDGEAYYTWVMICNATLLQGESLVIARNGNNTNEWFVGIKNGLRNGKQIFSFLDMNIVVGQSNVDYLIEELGLSKETVTDILSCISPKTGTDFIKELLGIKFDDNATDEFYNLFCRYGIHNNYASAMATYINGLIWSNASTDEAISAIVNGILKIDREQGFDDKRIDMFGSIYEEGMKAYELSLCRYILEPTQENYKDSIRWEYTNSMVSFFNLFFKQMDCAYVEYDDFESATGRRYVNNPVNCYIKNVCVNESGVTFTLYHTTCDHDYAECVSLEKNSTIQYSIESDTADLIELKDISLFDRIAGITVGTAITLIPEVQGIPIGVAATVIEGVFSIGEAGDELLNDNNEINSKIVDLFGSRCIAQFSKLNSMDSFILYKDGFRNGGNITSRNLVVFEYSYSARGELACTELMKNGTRELLPLSCTDIYSNGDEAFEAILSQKMGEGLSEEELSEDNRYFRENVDNLRKIYYGGFDIKEYINVHNSITGDNPWTDVVALLNAYRDLVSEDNDVYKFISMY